MRYDRSQYLEICERRRQERPVADTDFPEFLRQAAVRSEQLTRDPNWDIYLTRIQEQVNKLEKILATARAELEDAQIWDATELARIKSVVLESKAMINAFNIAMSYPKAIIEEFKQRQNLTDDVK